MIVFCQKPHSEGLIDLNELLIERILNIIINMIFFVKPHSEGLCSLYVSLCGHVIFFNTVSLFITKYHYHRRPPPTTPSFSIQTNLTFVTSLFTRLAVHFLHFYSIISRLFLGKIGENTLKNLYRYNLYSHCL